MLEGFDEEEDDVDEVEEVGVAVVVAGLAVAGDLAGFAVCVVFFGALGSCWWTWLTAADAAVTERANNAETKKVFIVLVLGEFFFLSHRKIIPGILLQMGNFGDHGRKIAGNGKT
ncbi:MAG TPA: hypothetical protein VFU15_09170 [Bacteroidia bacterium]|nr:hypothetical protein [Bacteroidia bacterium]